MITVENLTKRYGSFTAVDDISFEGRARIGRRLPRPEWRGQVDRDADDDRSHAADQRAIDDPGARLSPVAESGASCRRDAGRRRATPRAHPARRCCS
jgi:hypothetical protein